MRINHIVALVLLVMSAGAFAQTSSTPSGAYSDGLSDGTSALGTSAGAVTQSNVDSIGSTYQQGGGSFLNDPTVSGLALLFTTSNAGNVGLAQNGTQQMQTCANYVPVTTNPTQQQQAMNQFCDAVNQLARAPNYQQVSGLNKSDSMFTNQNNAYNQGMASAGSTNVSIGSGQTGAGACLQTSTTSPATYNNFSCISQAAQNGVPCTVQYSPTVTSTSFCNISGTSYVYTNAWPPGWYLSGFQTATQPLYQINFGCANASTGRATIQAYVPLWAYFYTCNYYPGLCMMGGNPNVWYPTATLNFVPGQTSAPVTWPTAINYNGSIYVYSTAYYDGPSGKIVVSNTVPAGLNNLSQDPYTGALVGGYYLGWPTQSCPANYTWVTPYVDSANNTVGGYCTNPADLTSVALPATPAPGICTIIDPYWGIAGCVSNPGGPIGYANCNAGASGACVVSYSCDSAHTLVGTTCYPSNNHVLPYSVASSANSGTAGIQNVLTNNVNNTCTQYQQKTSAPTATQAIAVNGQWTCPTGMTLNGSLCY